MKKKIAILTQPLGVNYGGIIQNYALQTVLKKMGYDPITINRWNNLNHSWFKKNKYYFKIHNIFYRGNFNFLKNHIKLTQKLDSDAKFYKHFEKNKYDAYVVGSDQTWRPKYSPNIKNYFLDFLKDKKDDVSKKIAYASSFGTSDWEYTGEQAKMATEMIKQFDAVSVREDAAVQLVENHLDYKAELVVDPTMLLSPADYRQLYKNSNLPKREGAFVYVLDTANGKNEIIQKIAGFLNLHTFRNQPPAPVSGKKESIKNRTYPPMETWVKAFDDAEFVVTDSFHGTVFSILYNKPFIAIVNKSRGSSRFISLLKQFGLENRLINDISDLSDALLLEKIDFSVVNQNLEVLRDSSHQFLKNNLD